LGPSRHLSREETLEQLPTLEPDGLRGGGIYYDGQFDDARLAVTLAQTAADRGAVVLNYVAVTRFVKNGDLLRGALARDHETGSEYESPGRALAHAPCVCTAPLRRLEQPHAEPIISPSQGVHIVLDKSFMPGDSAIMVPRT